MLKNQGFSKIHQSHLLGRMVINFKPTLVMTAKKGNIFGERILYQAKKQKQKG